MSPSSHRRIHRAISYAAASVLGLTSLASDAFAATKYWDGDGVGAVAGGPGQWNLSLNRWGATAGATTYSTFATDDTAVFGGSGGVVDLTASLRAGFDVQSNGYIFQLTPGNASTLGWGTTQTLNVATGVSSDLRFAANASLTAVTTLNKTGSGTFGFASTLAVNSATINLNAGTLLYTRTNANLSAGSFPSSVSIAAGATLNLGKASDTIGRLTGSGGIVLGTFNNATTSITPTPSSIYGSTLIANADSSTSTFSGAITDDGGTLANAPFSGGHFVKAGTGTLTLNGVGSNFRGSVLVTGGTLIAANGNAIPNAAPVRLADGTTFRLTTSEIIGSIGNATAVANTASTAVVDTQGSTLTVGGDNLNSEFSGVVAGSGFVIKNGSGKLILNTTTPVSTFTGRYTVNGGLLGFASDTRLGAVPTSPTSNYFTLNGGSLAPVIGTAVTSLSTPANRGITIGASGGGLSYNNPSGNTWTIVAPITGTGTLTRSGPANITLQGDNSGFTGDWVVTDGIMNLGSGPAGGAYDNQTNIGAEPAGTGSWDVSQARIQLANNTVPLGAQTYTLASGAGETFSYGPGVVMTISRGGNSQLTVTIGDPAASSSTLIRKSNGTMHILASTGPLNLGSATSEKLLFSGGVATVATNGGADTLVPGIFISQSDTTTEGHMATYDNAFGIQVAPPSLKTDINLANNTDYYDAESTTTNQLTAARSVYALKIGSGNVGATLDLNGQTLNIGSGPTTDPGQVIINNLSTIIAPNNVGTLAFGSREAIFLTQNGAGTVNATVTGSGGLTKMGAGTLSFVSTAVLNYSGATRIEQGSLSLNQTNQLPQTTDLIFCGAPSTTAGNNPQLLLNGRTVTVNSINTLNSAAGISTNAGGPVLQLGTNGVIKIQGSGSSTFNGRITSAGTTSTVWNAGPGTLVLGKPDATVSDRGAIMDYDKLWVTNGGTVVLPTSADLQSMPASAGTPLTDAYLLDNGTLHFPAIAGAAIGATTDTVASSLIINAGRGFTLGAGNGTVRIDSPYQEIALTGNGGIRGTATLTKTGDGSLLLPTGSTATAARWKLRVAGGSVTFQGDDSLGTAPTTLQTDNITLDGGAIDVSTATSFTLSANRGITVGPGGGTLRMSRGVLNIAGPLAGSGALRIASPNPANSRTFSGTSNGFSGAVTLATEGAVYANTLNALGTGSITNDAAYGPTFGTSVTSAITLNNSIITVGPRPWDFSVSNSTADLTLAGAISGNAPLFKGLNGTSPGTLQLTNTANSFTGELVVSQGILIPSANNVLGNTSSRLVVNGVGQLIFRNNLNYTSAKPLFISGGPNDVTTPASIQNTVGNNTFAGAVTLTSTTAIRVATGTTLTLTNDLAGGADSTLVKRDAGQLNVRNVRTGGLSIAAGNVRVLPNSLAAGVSNIRTFSLTAGTKLDLTNNKLVTANAIGTASGAIYTGVSGLVQTGRNNGLWNGNGITTSETSATNGSNYTALGVATGGNVLGLAPTATGLWAGQTVSGSDTLVMYTYGGDANLSGNVDIDDYGQIDFNASTGGSLTGWFNGDFDYNGVQDIDDYGIIDFVVNIQGAPFFASESAPMTISAVPEPTAACGLAVLGVSLLARRRRR